MKIKLSKSQWEGIGKKAGWMDSNDSLETCPCKVCGKATKMTGTELCDRCWMVVGYLQMPVQSSDKALVYRMTMESEPKIVERVKEMIENGEIS